jgi:hypothetical protein
MDRDEKRIDAEGLKSANECATIVATYIRLVHPVTQRFVAEYDPERCLLKVSDRGKTAVIDLKGLRTAL